MIDYNPEQLAYRVPDAIRISGLGRTKLYELAAAGRLRLIRVGSRTLIPAEDLKALVSPPRTQAA